MTAKGITGEQINVDRQNNRADPDAKRIFASCWIDKPECFPDIIGENPKEEERKIEKVTMHILHDERERPLAPVALARLAHCACGRISPKGFVVRAAVVVTGQPKSGG